MEAKGTGNSFKKRSKKEIYYLSDGSWFIQSNAPNKPNNMLIMVSDLFNLFIVCTKKERGNGKDITLTRKVLEHQQKSQTQDL